MPTLLVVLQLRLLLPCHLSVAEDGLAMWLISPPAHVSAGAVTVTADQECPLGDRQIE